MRLLVSVLLSCPGRHVDAGVACAMICCDGWYGFLFYSTLYLCSVWLALFCHSLVAYFVVEFFDCKKRREVMFPTKPLPSMLDNYSFDSFEVVYIMLRQTYGINRAAIFNSFTGSVTGNIWLLPNLEDLFRSASRHMV